MRGSLGGRRLSAAGGVGRYASRAVEGGNMKSTLQKAYGWDRTQWVLDETYHMEYDAQGQVTLQSVTDATGYISRDVNTYNDNGMLASRLTQTASREGAEFRNSSRLNREYDERVTSFITVNNQEVWVESAWRPSNDYRQNVVRDDAGNVIMMERTVYYGGIQDPVFRMKIEYGADGKATRIMTEELVNDYANGGFRWETSEIYSDIVWESTDGQILGIDDLFSGANRLTSATIEEPGDDLKIHMMADYGTGGDYRVDMRVEMTDMPVEVTGTYEYSVLDEYGSVRMHTTTSYSMPGVMSETEWYDEVYQYDAFGLILLEEATESADPEDEESGDVIVFRRTGEVEYDPETGYPLVWTVREYDDEVMEMLNAFRAEYYDYVDPAAGVGAVAVEGSAPEWYTLQGLRIAEPVSPGVYLRRGGGKVEKLIVR